MDFSNLKRMIQPMPPEIEERLIAENLNDDFKQRPAYQQNDYLAWIGRARRLETRQRRLEQMIAELRDGHLYMGMKYRGR